MIRLKNKYKGKAALSIMGGPAILENNFDLSLINKEKCVTFLEAKALTPEFLKYGLKPDYFLMFFPEKCQSNSLQHMMYQSFLVDFDISKLLKPEYIEEYQNYKSKFDHYFEVWNQERTAYKRYKLKNDVVLDNSPWKLLEGLPDMDIITRGDNEQRNVGPDINKLKNKMYFYYDNLANEELNIDKYFNPQEIDGCLRLNSCGRVNSAAMALYPLLNYMGFSKVYFIGMDMSLLGSMEYSAFHTFKSMKHFNQFFNVARQTYNLVFPLGTKKGFNKFFKSVREKVSEKNATQKSAKKICKNLLYDIWGLKGKFMRERRQFTDCKKLFSYKGIEFINIYEPFKYARLVPGIRNMSYKDFIANQ